MCFFLEAGERSSWNTEFLCSLMFYLFKQNLSSEVYNCFNYLPVNLLGSFPGGSDSKESACNARNLGLIPGSEDSLEKGMATHSSIFAWRTPWREEPGWLHSMGLQRVGHNQATNIHTNILRFCFPQLQDKLILHQMYQEDCDFRFSLALWPPGG